MTNYLSMLVFFVILVVGAGISMAVSQDHPAAGFAIGALWLAGDVIIANGVRLAAQWERAVVFRLGRYLETRGPGLFLVIPIVDTVTLVDTRIRAMDIPSQQVITRDNVPVKINGVIYFRVKAVVDDTLGWGLSVTGINIQDIDMPEDLKKMMSRQASAEREKRATITKAQGDREAADNLAAAARTMATSPGAMQLRTLQTLDGLGPTASNTVVIAVPVELMETVKALAAKSIAKKADA
jgi:regulator of protease activity HflC (stomatin/prohibitin superfamily)